MPLFASLDLGTNSCRLLVVEANSSLQKVMPNNVIDSYSRIVRLGQDAFLTGQISPQALKRGLGALKECSRKLNNLDVFMLRAITTETARHAINFDYFSKKVLRETGINLEIITPQEEAFYTLKACQSLIDRNFSHSLLFDIGGGSTEISITDNRKNIIIARGFISLPLGVSNLTENCKCYQLDKKELEGYAWMIANYFKRFDETYKISEKIAKGKVQIIGSAGSITTISAITLGLKRYNRHMIDGTKIKTQDVLDTAQDLALMTIEEREMNPIIGKDRGELTASGSAIIHAILKTWRSEYITIADRGVREGILLEMIDNHFNHPSKIVIPNK